jgi:cysteine desulfuration protein SufE
MLAEVVDEFATLPPRDRLELLLEYSQSLPPLEARFRDHPELLEPVPECQAPLFVAVEVDDDQRVRIHVTAPAESPTTRGFAAIFQSALDGLSVDEVLAVPGDIASRLSLSDVVSPLRLRGATALLGRIQRQVREQLGARSSPARRRSLSAEPRPAHSRPSESSDRCAIPAGNESRER